MILTITPNPLLDYKIFSGDGLPGGTRISRIPFTVGGKGINVARMLKTLGRPALALTFAGGGNGDRMIEGLRQQSISARLVKAASETRMGIELFAESPGQHRWWIEDGEELHEKEVIEMLDLIAIEAETATIIAMSGTISGRFNQDFYRRVLERLCSFNGEIYLDARGEALRQACRVGGFFLKHNRDEALESFGLDPFVEEQQTKLLKHFSQTGIWGAMITNVSGNVLMWDGKTCFEFAPAPAIEISSVGCGDATLAGLLYGRRNGMSLLEASLLGIAAGAADAEKSGPCEATYEEIKKKLGQIVRIKKNEIFQV